VQLSASTAPIPFAKRREHATFRVHAMTPTDPVPTPQQLFRWLDNGRITPEEFRQSMAVHAREIIQEMEQAHTNPLVA
jgi:hypothetical protein